MRIIEKTQSKYLSGYRKAVELIQHKMDITQHAWGRHKRLVKEAIRRKVFITQEREDYCRGKVSTGNTDSPCTKFIEVVVIPYDQESHCPCLFFEEEGLRCVHSIALLREHGKYVQDKWWFAA